MLHHDALLSVALIVALYPPLIPLGILVYKLASYPGAHSDE